MVDLGQLFGHLHFTSGSGVLGTFYTVANALKPFKSRSSSSRGSNIDPAIVIAIVVGSFLFVLLLVVLLVRRARGRMRQEQMLLATGIPAKARVLAMRHGGAIMKIGVQRHISLVLSLEVHMPGQAPYAMEVQKYVSELFIASFQPGAWLDVRLDPSNPNNLAIAGTSAAPSP